MSGSVGPVGYIDHLPLIPDDYLPRPGPHGIDPPTKLFCSRRVLPPTLQHRIIMPSLMGNHTIFRKVSVQSDSNSGSPIHPTVRR